MMRLFARRYTRKLTVFLCVLVSAIIIAGMNTSANNYDIIELKKEGVMPTAADVKPAVIPPESAHPEKSGDIRLYAQIESMDYGVIAGRYNERYGDDGGNILYSIKPAVRNGGEDVPTREGGNEVFIYLSDIPMNEELQLYTYEQCKLRGLNYRIVLALIWRESRFEADAINYNTNGTSDTGLMQINDINKDWIAKELGITNLLDPKDNIRAGTTLLGKLTEKHGEHYALMAYQYGEAGMEKKRSEGITTNKQLQVLYSRRDYYDSLYA